MPKELQPWRQLPMLMLLLLLLSCCCGQANSSPTFSKDPQPIYNVMEGSPITMECQAHGDKDKKSQAKKNFGWESQVPGSGNSPDRFTPSGRFNYSRRLTVGDLYIRAVDRSDNNKQFTCYVKSGSERTANNVKPLLRVYWLNPNVTVSLERPSNKAISLNDAVQLKCNYNASDNLRVRWFFNGRIFCDSSEISSNDKDCFTHTSVTISESILRISRLSDIVIGVYHCYVHSETAGGVLSVQPFLLVQKELAAAFGNPVVYTKPNSDAPLPVNSIGSISFTRLSIFGYATNEMATGSIDNTDSGYPVVRNNKYIIQAGRWNRFNTTLNLAKSMLGNGQHQTVRHFLLGRLLQDATSVTVLFEIVEERAGELDGSKNFEPPIIDGVEQAMKIGQPFTQRVYLPYKGSRLDWRPLPTIEWKGPDGAVIDGRDPSIRIDRQGDLVIAKVGKQHTGTYTVTIGNSFAKRIFRQRLLAVTAPILSKKQVEHHFKDGKPVSIKCEGDAGDVTVTSSTYFTWLLDNSSEKSYSIVASNEPYYPNPDKTMSVNSTDGSLILHSPRVNQSGDYFCSLVTYYSEAKRDTASTNRVKVVIKRRLRVCPLITKSVVFLEEGTQQEINCGRESPSVHNQWQYKLAGSTEFKQLNSVKDITQLIDSNTKLHYEIVLGKHNGVLRIIANDTNSGEVETRKIIIFVGAQPKFTVQPQHKVKASIGDRIRLNCSANGNPKPSIMWQVSTNKGRWNYSRDAAAAGTELSSGPAVTVLPDNSLLIRYASSLHTGQYSCIASTQYHIVLSRPAQISVGIIDASSQSRSSMARTIAIVVSCAVGYLGLIVFLSVCCALRMQRRKRKRGETQLQQQEQQQQQQQLQQQLQAYANSPGPHFFNGKGSDISCYEPTGRSIPAEYKSLLSQNREYTPPRLTADHLELQPNSQFDCRSLNSFSNSSYQSTNRLHTNTPANSVIESTLERVCRLHQKDRSRLHYRTGILGHGVFGIVRIGSIDNHTVLVKELTSDNQRRQNEFVEQMKMFAKCDHDYVTRMMGVCIDNAARPLLILEYCENGNLHELLLGLAKHKKPLTEDCQLRMCLQVAQALEHFHRLGFVHADLGCRNILVTQELNLKLTNMGPGLDRFTGQYAQNASGALMPIRWLPAEAVLHNQFGIKTDVWSFGVVVAEIFSHGRLPYSRLSDAEVLLFAQQPNFRPELPEGVNQQLQSLVDRCWSSAPDRRPTAGQVVNKAAELTRDLADV